MADLSHAEPAVPVTIAVAQLESLQTIRSAVGWIEPVASVKVRTRVEGEVVERLVEDGQEVAAGDLLLRLDDGQIQAQIAREEATLARDVALLSRIEADLNRARDLNSRQITSQAQLDQLTAEAKAAHANVTASAAAVQASRIRLGYTLIRAPIDGRVGVVRPTKGAVVGPSDDALLTVTQIKRLQVVFALPERDLALVRKAMKETPDLNLVRIFTSSGDRAVAIGRLSFLDSSVDTNSATIQLKALVTNEDESLWPGQYARIEVRLGESLNAVTVPSAAIQHLDGGSLLFVVGPDDRVQLRSVSVSGHRGGRVAVWSGVKAGEHVVLDGHSRIRTGTKVSVHRPIEEPIRGLAEIGRPVQ